jgi:hypothetical protein
MEYTTLPEVMAKLTTRWQGQNGQARTKEELEVCVMAEIFDGFSIGS